MRIEVLGPGCARCESLLENVEAAVRRLGIEAEVVKVTKIDEMARRGILATPALVIDGVLKATGKVLTPDEVAGLLG